MTEEWSPASEVLIGVRENQMIINGIVYCDFCWCQRPDDRSLCPCLKDQVRSCEDCANTKDPCLFCQPTHHANHKLAMAEMEKILASLETETTSCDDEYDADYNEHRFEY